MAVRPFSRPAIPLLAAIIAGITIGVLKPGQWLPAIPALLFCIGFTIGGAKRKGSPWPIPMLLFIFLGYLSIQPWLAPLLPHHHFTFLENNQKLKIRGIIISKPVVLPNRITLILHMTDMEKNN